MATRSAFPVGERRETPEISVHVESASVVHPAAAPTLSFGLRIEAGASDVIRSLVLTTQIRIAVSSRSYDERARERLAELFGEPSEWARSANSLFWTQNVTLVPGFTGETRVEVPVACTYDFEVATAKYFDALRDGEVPLLFLFSGTIFYRRPDGALQTILIPWDRESRFRLPVALWREAMDRHFPGSAWIRVPRETFDRLHRYKSRQGLLDWGSSLERLLDTEEKTS